MEDEDGWGFYTNPLPLGSPYNRNPKPGGPLPSRLFRALPASNGNSKLKVMISFGSDLDGKKRFFVPPRKSRKCHSRTRRGKIGRLFSLKTPIPTQDHVAGDIQETTPIRGPTTKPVRVTSASPPPRQRLFNELRCKDRAINRAMMVSKSQDNVITNLSNENRSLSSEMQAMSTELNDTERKLEQCQQSEMNNFEKKRTAQKQLSSVQEEIKILNRKHKKEFESELNVTVKRKMKARPMETHRLKISNKKLRRDNKRLVHQKEFALTKAEMLEGKANLAASVTHGALKTIGKEKELSAELKSDVAKITEQNEVLLAENTGLKCQLIDMETQLHEAI